MNRSLIDSFIKKAGYKMKEKNLSLVTAESCTGGGLAYFFSKSPEYSAILERAYVTYSNPAKESLLNVKQESIQTKGAVSEEVAVQMAQGALKNSHAQVSISITGIAGEKGKSGLVWITCMDVFDHQYTKTFKIDGDRETFIHEVILQALKTLLTFLNRKY